MWVNGDGFLDIVKEVWQRQVRGCLMFKVTQNLKMLKLELKKLNHNGFSDIQAQALQAYKQIINAQNQAHIHVRDAAVIAAEKSATEHSKQAHGRYLSFLREKTKERWIDKRDDNTKLFHQSIKARRQVNRVFAIQDGNGVWQTEDQLVKDSFVGFYKGLLGEKLETICAIKSQIIAEGAVLSTEQQQLLECNFTREDVKRVM